MDRADQGENLSDDENRPCLTCEGMGTIRGRECEICEGEGILPPESELN